MPVPACMLRPEGWVGGGVRLELPDCVATPPLDGRTRMVPGGTPAAVNVTTPSDSGPDTIGNVGVGPMPVANASRLLVPAARTQESTRATPSAPVTTCVGVTLPALVDWMRKCTVAPATGALFASVTSNAGGVATASPSAASWSSPARTAILAGNAHPMSLKQQLDPPTPKWTIDA